ncbi:SCO0930 family lipoprotein [Streptomyces sp. LX-29]|uniref:SCO0930 family lipoprotein n=1 Tax=Streptomyces sp. LX-29 TaxID=2900152 RepID=UPI00321BCD0C
MRNMRNKRHAAFAGAAATLIMLTAGACGGEDNKSQESNNKVQPVGDTKDIGKDGYGKGKDYGSDGYGSDGYGSDAGSAAEGEGADVKPAEQLSVREDAKLGEIVTDSRGFTLYRFDKDTPKPPKSNCDGDCATAWPVVPADDASAAAGMDSSLLGSVVRSDGSKQLTLGGWPVYRFAKDTKAGDTKGHGVGGTWNALAPDGKKAGQAGGGEQGEGWEQDAGAADTELTTTEDPKLGTIIVDGKRMTLYRFNKDSAWPMKFACNDACLDTWKPAPPVDKTKVEGVADKLVTTVTRPDGTKQLAIDCWPVYTFTGDAKPGDTNGQGKQGLWFAVTKDGKKAGVAAGE